MRSDEAGCGLAGAAGPAGVAVGAPPSVPLSAPLGDLHDATGRWLDLRADLDAARAGLAGQGAAGFGPALAGPVRAWLGRWDDDVGSLAAVVDDLARSLQRTVEAYEAVDGQVASAIGRLSR